ncbi:MAG: CRISPR-associated protein Cas4 [Alicyclobacillus herbarius]|uniref:CRISPR-associated protein Cas4 n=1 Tax=Alicyclobacillus herbarius TaxID=122960 RepID=UPI0006855863|nr:CRISPR-associated protein Cas4 [Alicyclobacillus herbarius]MCL6633312.1 CRISPR-associated protein Cas4 [Alicyclobacillus herbarius]
MNVSENLSSESFVSTVPLSALQHYSYCPRQCALIHVEQIFDENVYTMKGRWAHRRVDEEHVKSSAGNEIVTAFPVWSDRYGLTGKCDVVEIRNGVPYPIEFKHGRRKAHVWDEVQLCGQAICLEEMFHVSIKQGDIYHISSRRRRTVALTSELRMLTLRIAEEVRQMIDDGIVPPAVNDARCAQCSLQSACMPDRTDGRHLVKWKEFLEKMEV